MPQIDQCPDPGLEQAVRPYLRSRHDVAQTRKALHSYLEKGLSLQDKQLHINNLTRPSCAQPLSEAPAALTGVHKAYWNALKAHQEAQAKYAQLKAEIQELTKPSEISTSYTSLPSADDILPLLRQRERQRKLQVIQSTLTGLATDENAPTSVTVDDFIKARTGDMPIPPGMVNEQRHNVDNADARMLDLKRAILTAKATIDKHEDDKPLDITPEPHAELYALQQTRNMLITWIEKQLVIIGDAQAANEKSTEAKLTVNGEDAPIPVSQAEIAQIYEQYLSARRKLLQALQHPKEHTFASDLDPRVNGALSPGLKQTDVSDGLAASMLPYIQPFMDMLDQESASKQQLASSKKQLSVSEAMISQVLRRLGDESHLVLPGSSTGQDWHRASTKAKQATSEAIGAKIKIGFKATAEAEGTLQRIDVLKAALES